MAYLPRGHGRTHSTAAHLGPVKADSKGRRDAVPHVAQSECSCTLHGARREAALRGAPASPCGV
eukprot:15431992-Alexandrium_andersonii.AAC.1